MLHIAPFNNRIVNCILKIAVVSCFIFNVVKENFLMNR